jgi:DNA-binding response OmpR family regulator
MQTNPGYRPCLVLALADPPQATDAARRFRRLGWDVYPVKTGPEARRVARMVDADLVVLDTDLPAESGWLTCAKLVLERPRTRVVLYGDVGERYRVFATFVGAHDLIDRAAGVEGLVREASGALLEAG